MNDVSELVDQVRGHYLQHFLAFAEIQRTEWTGRGALEVIFEVPEPADLFRRLYRVDFALKNGDELVIRELEPDKVLTFNPFIADVRGTSVYFERLEWRDVVLQYEGAEIDAAALNRWFNYWFDPDDARYSPDAALSQTIHALFVRPGYLCVDFGTATAEAFWDLLDIVASASIDQVRITRQEDE